MRAAALLLAPVFAALVLAVPAGAQTRAESDLGTQLSRALGASHAARSLEGAVAVDLTTGHPVFARNAGVPLEPASTEKLAVTYAALTLLGPAFRIETDVLGQGELRNGVWRGDVYLQGHGDPSLSSSGLRRLAAQLHSTGIRRISGAIVGDESWFDSRRTAAGWKPSFYIDESPPLSALAVDRARYHGLVSREPALGAAFAFRDALRAAGISVGGAVTTGRTDATAFPLAYIVSPSLASLVYWMDHESDNFAAELLLKEVGAVASSRGTSAAGAAVVLRELATSGVPTSGVRIVDGSGLSLLDRLTANALVGILQAANADATVRAPLLAALPVAGESGTLVDRMRRAPARGRVLAKTGTTNEASALAGYAGGRFAFAVIENGHPVAYYRARIAQDRFATVLAGQ